MFLEIVDLEKKRPLKRLAFLGQRRFGVEPRRGFRSCPRDTIPGNGSFRPSL